jgi:4,5-dihydroxyphthalate decarboxylase
MSNVPITVALGDYDHVRDLFDGTVKAEGIDFTLLRLPTEEMFYRFATYREWDVSEMSFAKCVGMAGSGDHSVVPIPVFVSRAFRHSAIYVLRDSAVQSPKDLTDKRVGVPEWAQTAGVYVRGMLQHYYDVDLKSITWVQGGVNEAGRKEKAALKLPSGIRLSVETERSLSDMLLDGSLNAVISARPPAPFTLGDDRIRRMIADPRTVELKYWKDTGIFPIMHILVLRRDVYEKHRWLANNLVSAFEAAKQRSLRRMSDITASFAPLPWLADYARLSMDILGQDFWPYGVGRNEITLNAFFEYAHEQGVGKALLDPAQFFAPETLTRAKV